MYSLPSTSKMCEPSPRAMNGGLPPTLRKARTGELTPPGMSLLRAAEEFFGSEWFMDLFGKIIVPRLAWLPAYPALRGTSAAEAQAHADVVQAAVQIAQQPALQAE